MQVIATAGHVDHGKSTLVRALTGMEPDRWAEERRRGMTIDLGFAWTRLPSGTDLAFVDVPGHERFIANMLAGVGPVPAALLVVAADGGWSAQTAEHVAALNALGVDRALAVVSRADLADPAPVAADVARRLGGTSLAGAETVAVSARRGDGMDALRAALSRLVDRLPVPAPNGRVRLWVDRCFSVKGFGTVVTGTLGAGRLEVGDRLCLGDSTVVVRGLQQLGREAACIDAVARAAVNLRGVARADVRRGESLLTPGAWHRTDAVDVRLVDPPPPRLPRQLLVHIGSAAVPATVRSIDQRHLRLRLSRLLPLEVGDRALLRDPGTRMVLGSLVLDPAPPGLGRRGASRRRSQQLARAGGLPSATEEVSRRRAVPIDLLRRLGVTDRQIPAGALERGGWWIADDQWEEWRRRLVALVERGDDGESSLVGAGVSDGAATARLDLPAPGLLADLVASCPALEMAEGRVRLAGRAPALDATVAEALGPLLGRLATSPFRAPEATELAATGLSGRQLAAAAAAGVVLRLPGDILLPPDAAQRAADMLASLGGPFDVSTARRTLGTTRRVAVPLMEHLDRLGLTRRHGDLRQVVGPRTRAGGAPGR